MVRCVVDKCKNNSNKLYYDATFHKFPKQEPLRQLWIEKCKVSKKINVDNRYVCSEHFSPDLFERDFRSELMGTKRKATLVSGAVPNKNLPDENKIEELTGNRKVIYLPDDEDKNENGEISETDNFIVCIQENMDDVIEICDNEETDHEKDKIIKDLKEKLDLLLLEYQILKDKNLEQQVKIKILQKENATLKKLCFAKKS